MTHPLGNRSQIYVGRLESNPQTFALAHINDRGNNVYNFLLSNVEIEAYISDAYQLGRKEQLELHNGIPKDVQVVDKNVKINPLSPKEFSRIKELAGLELELSKN